MKLTLIFLLAVCFVPLGSMAQAIPSQVQTREWSEKHPPRGMTLRNSDKYVDYRRDGNIVFRTVERTVTIGRAQPTDEESAKVVVHLIEFVADGNVFATVGLSGGSALNWTLNSVVPVHFTSGPSRGAEARFFYVCVPQHDYFEYLEIKDSEVVPTPDTPQSRANLKRHYMERTAKGFVHPLGKEELLDTTKP
jgi:hypothetical protein